MKNIPIKLNHLVEEFHYFEDNQVLTASHLNTVVDFLDRRDRMTRTHLIGTGIVCGLEVSFNNTNKTITISKGAAITSDGDLVHINSDTTYSHIRVFEDEKAKYELFQNGSLAIPLFQIFPEGSEEENISSMRGRNNPVQNMQDMAVVLYLNSFLEAPEDCTEVDCENHGMRQRAQLLPLLINKGDLLQINNKPTNSFFDLPEVNIARVNFHKSTITHEENLLNRFREAIKNSTPRLTKALVSTCGSRQGDFLRNLIAPLYSNPAANWKTRLDNIFNNINITNRPDALYIYNFCKDLAEAYEEFKEAVYDLWVECCPDPEWHPKHVMLQEILLENENQPAIFRHHFCESPILNHRDKRVKKAQHLHQRIHAMISHFAIPINDRAPIKITPSKQGDFELGEKSIPYYYNHPSFDLNRFWNYKKTVRNQFDSILGYHANLYNGNDLAQNPLNFCHDKYNFYRIEGHLGKTRETVENQLELLKKENNLHFHMVAIQIQDNHFTIKLPPWRRRFPAIDVLFHHYREEFASNVNIVNQFHTDLEAVSTQAVTDRNTPEDKMREDIVKSKGEVNSMKDEMTAAKSQMNAKLDSFDKNYVSFKTNFQKAAIRGDIIHKNIYDYTQTKYESPIQKFVLDSKFNRFDGLLKYYRKKKEKIQQQYIFDKFFEQNTGLESLGGVYKGGTFVLVYTASEDDDEQRVVADFCLPSSHVVEIDPEVEPAELPTTEIDPPVITEVLPPIKFIETVDLFKYKGIKEIVDYKFLANQTILDNKFQTIDNVLIGGGLYTGDVTNTGGLNLGNNLSPNLTDPALRNMMDSMKKTSNEIVLLESKDTLTFDEKRRLDFSRKDYEATGTNALEYISKKDGDVGIVSDETKFIEFLGTTKDAFKEKDKFKKIDKKAKDIKSNDATKVVLTGVFDRYKIGL